MHCWSRMKCASFFFPVSIGIALFVYSRCLSQPSTVQCKRLPRLYAPSPRGLGQGGVELEPELQTIRSVIHILKHTICISKYPCRVQPIRSLYRITRPMPHPGALKVTCNINTLCSLRSVFIEPHQPRAKFARKCWTDAAQRLNVLRTFICEELFFSTTREIRIILYRYKVTIVEYLRFTVNLLIKQGRRGWITDAAWDYFSWIRCLLRCCAH